jgi:serine/threonine protein kinase
MSATRLKPQHEPADRFAGGSDHNVSALPNGYRLKDYCIECVLGQGGFGITYKAHDELLHRHVAIKEFMPDDLAVRHAGSTVMPRSTAVRQDYRGGLQRFLVEARTLAQFSHPNIVRILTLFEANGTAYIVMNFEAGESLANHLQARRAPLPAAELMQIAEPLLDGLAAVHKAGFLHRDIKPANIFLRANNDPVLLDFGTARQVVGTVSRSIISILTPGYAPIEQYNAQNDQGCCTDIYAVGAVLYSCITGAVPIDAPARAQAQIEQRPDPLRPAVLIGHGRYPGPFLKAIDRALSVGIKDRLQTVDELRKAVIAGRPLVSIVPRPAMLSRLSKRWPALAAGGGLTLLFAASGILLYQQHQQPDPYPQSDQHLPQTGQYIALPSGQTAALENKAEASAALEAVQVLSQYGRQTSLLHKQQAALPSLERLAKTDVTFQKQLDDFPRRIDSLDRETSSLMQRYLGLVDQLSEHADWFDRVKGDLKAADLPPTGELARQRLIADVAARTNGPLNVPTLRANIDRLYATEDLR